MKAIINTYTSDQAWCEEIFPEWSLCSLPVAGRPFSEYLFDLCSVLGIGEVLLLDYNFDTRYNEELSRQQDRWPLHFTYTGARLCNNIDKLLSKNSSYIGADDTLIINGAVLPKVCPENIDSLDFQEIPDGNTQENGLYLRKNGILYKCVTPFSVIDSLLDYYNLNFDLLSSPNGYILAGYSSENNVHLGMDIAIMPNVDIKPPVLLRDCICLERDCKISDCTIIGNNVLVGNGTTISHSIILDYTYIGHGMEFNNKIVSENRIIDPESGFYTDLMDMGAASSTRSLGLFSLYNVFEYLIALALVLCTFIPYIIYWPFNKLFGMKMWAYKLSYDRFPKLCKVLIGKARLIKYLQDDRIFVFRASDGLSSFRTYGEAQHKIDDTYYRHSRSVKMILKIVVKGLIRRLLANDWAFANEKY